MTGRTRKVFLPLFACLAVLVALPASADAVVIGKVTVSVSGSISSSWQYASRGPCSYAGPGSAKVSFGTPKDIKTTLYGNTRGSVRGVSFGTPDPKLTGAIDATDGRTQVPETDPNELPCRPDALEPCGKSKLSKDAHATLPVGVVEGGKIGMDANFLIPRSFRCETGGLEDYTRFTGANKAKLSRIPFPSFSKLKSGKQVLRFSDVYKTTSDALSVTITRKLALTVKPR